MVSISGCVFDENPNANLAVSDESGASTETGAKVSFTPSGTNIKFTWSSDGIEASYSITKITYLGKFDLTVYRKYFFKPRPYFTDKPVVKQSFYEDYVFEDISLDNEEQISRSLVQSHDKILVIIRKDQDVDIFKIPPGKKIVVISKGGHQNTYATDYNIIDASHAVISEIKLLDDERYIEKSKQVFHPDTSIYIDKGKPAEIVPDTFSNTLPGKTFVTDSTEIEK